MTKAKEYFKASGLPEGTPVKFLLMANQKDKGEVIQAMLGQVGFERGVRRSRLGRVEQQGHRRYDYDLLLGTMTGIFDPDRPYGYLTKASGSATGWCGGYDSAQMNDLLAAGKGEVDVAKRQAIYKQVVQLVQDDAATIYVLGLPWVEAWQNTVKGYQPGTSPALDDDGRQRWVEQGVAG